tara:strand:- start:10562 stop:11236 length:675 start_codon:yes stop_codon:yes gene_type:complete
MAGLTTVTAPATTPITATEAGEYLRLDSGVDATLLGVMVDGAADYVEAYTNRSMINRTLKYSIDYIDELDYPLHDGFSVGPDLYYRNTYLNLPRPPVSSVTHVKFFDDADTENTFSTDKYYLDNQREPARVKLRRGEVWPTALRVSNAIEVTYVSGYGATSADVPAQLRLAMLQYVAFIYENRGDSITEGAHIARIPQAIRTMLDPFRVRSLSRNPFDVTTEYM